MRNPTKKLNTIFGGQIYQMRAIWKIFNKILTITKFRSSHLAITKKNCLPPKKKPKNFKFGNASSMPSEKIKNKKSAELAFLKCEDPPTEYFTEIAPFVEFF